MIRKDDVIFHADGVMFYCNGHMLLTANFVCQALIIVSVNFVCLTDNIRSAEQCNLRKSVLLFLKAYLVIRLFICICENLLNKANV